ncbi:lysine--tRNA ligase [Candidatus Saccharibacteria bacterium]|nr:MAG: lysine--tRNA ligase [Candidatus Saccharibacteria bacterium]
MQWLNTIVDQLVSRQAEGEILIESGGSPSGTYHLGHLREVIICDAIMLELRRRGREAKHVYFVDDLDALRKIPVNIPADFEKYLGMPLCDIPAPEGVATSYAEHFMQGMRDACSILGIEVEFILSHQRYRSGYFVPAIERSLSRIPEARRALETVSGRELDEHWSPIQIMEKGRLKNRRFVGLKIADKTITYLDTDGVEQTVRYDDGKVKLDWRLDWPGRWWLMRVAAEPFGRDHASAGGSFATGVEIMKDVYEAPEPYPVPYDFINMAGDTKKMSASKGTGLDAMEGAALMPSEVIRYFVLGVPPSKRLYFDPVGGVVKLMDEYAAFAAKPDKSPDEEQLLYICTRGGEARTVSRVPFSHLVASYQASLRDPARTLEVVKRTEHSQAAVEDAEIITRELQFIDAWLDKRAPDEVKFSLRGQIQKEEFSENEVKLFARLAEKTAAAPEDADGEYFHLALYSFKDELGMQPKEIFSALYRLLLGKTSGPRAGYFLSILPRDWLLARLRLEK